ncbi:MAG: hypothetical protein MK141_14155 [Pseudoxanthomonas sp.]|jgi:DNA-binding IclR family transcriptional regulator|uniref:hypothetical protein n=1 Tax=Pseudoxanthomonas sp. TaxID=1871049 RepID=UPI0025830D25|nr:hypothetical protein [Pseudoxanthomonas sp.]MCH2092702.1 hypothetical protein [Pseudoxanthomonas sp.]
MADRKHDYHNTAQERALKALLILSGHELEGLTPTQFANALGIKPALATRDLWNLQHAGFAEQLANGKWRLGPKPVQIALAFQRGLSDINARVNDITNRFTREPK